DQLGFEPVTVVEFAAGSTTVLSSRVAIRTAWSAGARGDALLLGVAASPPNGDGAAVDLGRLDTVVSVVGDLVDASAIRTSTIAEIPPEFAAPGIDGVLFTVGTARPEVRTRSALLVRYSGGGQGGDI